MKFISNLILVVLSYLFLNSSLLYADTTNKELLEKIKNNELQNNDLFPNLYKGDEGKELRKYLQNYIIEKILTFIEDNKTFPSIDNFYNFKIGNISYQKIFGTNNLPGIFDGSEDCFIKIFEYIDEFFPETSTDTQILDKRASYLNALYTAHSLAWITDENILKRCRENIKEKIENNELQNDYLFPNLYKGYEGKKFIEFLQKYIIQNILTFIDNNNNKFPSKNDFDNFKIVNINYQKIFGTNNLPGIFDGSEDCFKKLLEYIDQIFPETSTDTNILDKRASYLNALYTAHSLAWITDENILKRCRENIKEKIENNELQNDYIFPNLYKGYEGKEFIEFLQKYIIQKILTFIDNNNNKFPSKNDFYNFKIGNISYQKIFGINNLPGIFDSSDDLMLQMLKYIKNNPQINPNQKELYLKSLFKASYLTNFFKAKVANANQTEFVQMILDSEELTKLFIECRGQKYLDEITRFVNTLEESTNQENTNSIQEIHCPTLFSTEQNP